VHFAAGLATTIVVFPFAAASTKRALVRRWSARLLRLLNIEARIDGQLGAQGGNVLIVANHVSWLDIFVLNAQQPARFVGKSELQRWPLAGRLMRDVGTIFIARERRHDTRRVNHHAAQALASGDIVAVFPEGTTSDGTTLMRFHASLLQPVVESQGHVQPVAIRYRGVAGAPSTAPAYGDETFAACFWRICGERRLTVEVTVPAALPAHRAHRRELARAAESAIRTALGLPPGATAPGTRGDPAAGSR
jgi:1-acyl-sn-glycerol-3-phosphate acyltransferase